MSRLEIDDIEDFLDSHIHFLSKLTKADDFMTWLRTKRVLSQEDQEEINAIPATRKRAALLVDVVKRKGRKGFDAYMEVLEWVYPGAFAAITGLEPKSPPDSFEPRKERASVALIKELTSCVQLIGTNLSEKHNVEKLKETVSNLQEENEKIIRELSEKEGRLEESNKKLEDLTSENVSLKERICDLDMKKKALSDEMTDKNEQLLNIINQQTSDSEINLQEHIQNLTAELKEKREENDELKRNIDKQLKRNENLNSDINKAIKANNQQRKTISCLRHP